MSTIPPLNALAGSLQSSIDAAMKRLQNQKPQDEKPDGPVEVFEQETRKSAHHTVAFATDVGVLVKDTSRLNVMSSLGKTDPLDFFKLKVATTGDVALGRVGDEGVRLQFMDRRGTVIADSDPKAGATHENYKKMQAGTFTMEKGDYTVRVSRDKGVPITEQKNYAFQLRMGTYSKDYDTIARQPSKTDAGGVPNYLQLLTGNFSGFGGGGSPALRMLGGIGGRGRMFNGLF